jgi:hypothetical protein
MMEQLAAEHCTMRREEDAAGAIEALAESDEDSEDGGDGTMTRKMAKKRFLFHPFFFRYLLNRSSSFFLDNVRGTKDGGRQTDVFHLCCTHIRQSVLKAYREKVAQERQLQFLRELDDEDKITKDRETKRQNQNQKNKDKKRLETVCNAVLYFISKKIDERGFVIPG